MTIDRNHGAGAAALAIDSPVPAAANVVIFSLSG